MPVSLGTSQPAQALKSGAAKLWTLLIGVNHYQEETLPSLQYPAPDCQGLAQALKAATQAFPSKELSIYHDFAQQLPTLAAVRKRLTEITSAAQPQDTVLIYFSGHGIFDAESQQVVLCLSDTRRQQLHSTGLRLQELLEALSQSLARQQLIWLDACHSGGFTLRGAARSKDATPLSSVNNPTPQMVEVLRQRAAQGKGFYALLSCDQTQRSWEFPELGHGVFTYFLMRGLRGEAADAQGVIDADGLYKYVYHQTLRYIDQANQQIRLVNRQKKAKGQVKGQTDEQQTPELYSEYPLQTPKRIVEGMGEMVLGLRPQSVVRVPRRRALMVDGLRGHQTTLALSQRLQNLGQYAITYWPQPGQPWEGVKAAIQDCLAAPAKDAVGENNVPPTVLLYLRGRLEQGSEGEAWLVVGDRVRIHRDWLRRSLRQASHTRQLIILDCPEATDPAANHTLQAWIEELQIESDRGQCIIAAPALRANPNQFAQALLDTLSEADNRTGLPVAAWITQLQLQLAGASLAQGEPEIGSEVLPLSWLSGTQGVIEVVPAQVGIQASGRAQALDLGVCPYMGLRAFGLEQSQYFYGRDDLTAQIIERLRQGSALGLIGASGSGKSSVLQAGVLAQLYQGTQIPDSERWWIRVIRPGATPIKSLAQQLVDPGTERERSYQALQIESLLYQGSDGFVQWLRSRPEPIVTLAIDQFEELFTLAPESERQPFLELLFGALDYAGDRFKLILSMRADFLPNALDYPALASMLQTHSILVPPRLTAEAYREAILKPAEQVGLQIEPGLVELLLQEVEQAAGELPLLEFVLEKLWENRRDGQLTLSAYQHLGGLRGALERQAQAVYDSLEPAAQDCARWIFLALTQLGDGTEDTRRRILKSDLVVARYPAELVDDTLRVLTAAKLVVIRADDTPPIGYSRGEVDDSAADDAPIEQPDDDLPAALTPPEPTVEVVHESLIRHWSTLRWWLAENRSRLQLQRQLSQQAADWQQNQQQPDFLLTGVRLAAAEELYIKYTDELSDSVQQYIEAGLAAREQQQRQAKRQLRRARRTAATLGLLGLMALGMGAIAYRQNIQAQRRQIEALNASSEALLQSNQQLSALQQSIQSASQLQRWGWMQRRWIGQARWQPLRLQTAATLEQALRFGRELNRLEGHARGTNAVQFSADGQHLVSASADGSAIVWRQNGSVMTQIELAGEGVQITDVRSTLDPTTGQMTLLIGTNQGAVELWQVDLQGKSQPLKTLKGHQDWVTSVAISPDGTLLASASRDRTIKLWKSDGTPLKTLKGHTGWVNRVRFSPDGQTLASASEDKTVRLWRRNGQAVRALKGHKDRTTDIAFSPDSQAIASTSADGTFQLWTVSTGASQYQIFQAETDTPVDQNQLNAIAFSADGQTLAVAGADARIQLWRASDGLKLDTLLGHSGEITSLSFSEGRLASASTDATVRLWTIEPVSPLADLGIHSVSVSPTAANPYLFATADFEGQITLWQSEPGQQAIALKTLSGHQGAVEAVAFNPAGTHLASAGSDGQVILWRAAEGTRLDQQAVNPSAADQDKRVTSLAFSADGKYLATGGADKTVRLWSVAGVSGASPSENRLTPIATLSGHTDAITSLSFHPSRPLLLSSSYDQTVRLWQLPTARQMANQSADQAILLQTLSQPGEAVSAVQFSPTGDRFAAASWDGQIYRWRLRGQSPQSLSSLSARHGGVSSLTFSPDSQTLISGHANGSLQLWDAETGQRLKQLLGEPGTVNTLGLSADAQFLVSGAKQGGLSLWNLQMTELIDRGCDRLDSYLRTNPTLTPAEKTLCADQ